MIGILIFIIGAGVGFLVGWLLLRNKLKDMQEMEREEGKVQREINTEREIWYGFSEFNEKMVAIKKERKERILEELKKVGKLRTSRVTDLLDISRATAFRYLEELEKESAIEQVGKAGREVEYKIK